MAEKAMPGDSLVTQCESIADAQSVLHSAPDEHLNSHVLIVMGSQSEIGAFADVLFQFHTEQVEGEYREV